MRLPIKHSRKKLPITVTDPTQRAEWTQEVLECPDGRLFAHLYGSERDREDAWRTADATVQKVEALIRGYAFAVPGTIWNRWVPNKNKQSNNNDASAAMEPAEAMDLQHELLLKSYNEGEAYMTVRNLKLQDLHGPNTIDPHRYDPPVKQKPGDGDLIPLDAKKYVMDSDLERFNEHFGEEAEKFKHDAGITEQDSLQQLRQLAGLDENDPEEPLLQL